MMKPMDGKRVDTIPIDMSKRVLLVDDESAQVFVLQGNQEIGQESQDLFSNSRRNVLWGLFRHILFTTC
jgi:hypothetical protein